ncbi:hypothetical protein CWE08_08260 [Aliidiomarina iranensis]|uniref:VanZ-like domain-containing protein n=1 Tax=Aliidiomarina iranensis TaxID=1434071 RepID=A0A432VVH7_9GAMM|nr:VanZ family protein [Aliidiomarina iranensis]RUO20482.1 hypothetical protein CWE08_08260 [Aliidiomarina iranensis]
MFWRILFLLVVVVVSALFVVQTPPTPAAASFPNADKVVHFGLFFILATTMHLAFRARLLIAIPLLLVYAVVIEIVQHHIPGRGAEVLDVVADMLGVLAFYLARALYKNRKKRSL